MRRRDFLQWTGMGGAALGLAPALAVDALTVAPGSVPGSALTGDSVQLTVLGLEGPGEVLRDVSDCALELAHPIRDVTLWAHRGASVPSTGAQVSQTVALDSAGGLKLFVSTGRTRRSVKLRTPRRGVYRIPIDRHNQLLFGVEDSRNV